jgi:DNA-binding transcriptional regulator YhcF (GntR family)
MTKKITPPEFEAPSLVREHERKSDPLFKIVRELALNEQTDAPQLFLSLRQAAQRFDVPVSAMADVYRRLADEGILSSVRSSRTILRGRGSNRHLNVRGVIAMPVSRPRLHTLRDYREAFVSLSQELHAHGFFIVPFYSEERALDLESVVKRAKGERVDLVISLLPEGKDRETALRLRDLGIRFIGLNIGGISDGFSRYEVRRQQAILAILNRWRAEEEPWPKTIVLAGHETAAETERISRLRGVVAREGFACDFDTVPKGRISRFLKSVCARQQHVLLPAPAAAMLGSRAPDTLAEVFNKCRIALIDGPLDAPFCKGHPEIKVDLVTVNWPRISKRIAHDLVTGDAFSRSETTIFEGTAHLHAPLNKLPRVPR